MKVTQQLNQIFDPENKFFLTLSCLTDIVGLSLLWLVLCLPLFTVGMATSALYDTSLRAIRLRNLSSTYRHFWQNLTSSWAVLLGGTFFWLLLGWALYYTYHVLVFVGNQGNRLAGLLYFAFHILILLVTGICLWFFILLSRYQHGFVSGHLLALQLAFRHPLVTLIMAALIFQMIQFTLTYWWPILFTPALSALLLSLFVEKIWQKYDPENSPLAKISSPK